MEITSKEIMILLEAGLAKAEELSEPSCVSVVDQGGNIAGFARSTDAMFGTAEIALTKAYTSAAFKMPCGDLQADAQPGGEIFNVETSGRGRNFTALPGGFPLLREGVLIGAIGVSGGPIEHDILIAKAMLAAFEG